MMDGQKNVQYANLKTLGGGGWEGSNTLLWSA